MSSQRRKTDARNPIERLTTAQREEIVCRGISTDIARGCAIFWNKRDMAPPSFAGEYSGERFKRAGDGTTAQGEASKSITTTNHTNATK